MKDNIPFVSVIIPCRNEEKFIAKGLDSVLENEYPHHRLEIILVDGMSEDRTRNIIGAYCDKYHFIKLLDNKDRIVPPGLNAGIREAKGEIIIRLDAHNLYEKDYISKCVKYLNEFHVDNVGGVWITIPGSPTLIASTIAMVLSHPFGVGNAHFRTGTARQKFTDTVPFGCYRREVFDTIGFFNEKLVRNQDIEFNLRLAKHGGKILLAPDIVSYYHARSNLKDIFKQNFWNGFWVIYSLKFANLPFSIRHLVPSIFVLSLLGSLIFSQFNTFFLYTLGLIIGSYVLANTLFSAKIALKSGLIHFPLLFITFFTLHFSYGIGSIGGMLKLLHPFKLRKIRFGG